MPSMICIINIKLVRMNDNISERQKNGITDISTMAIHLANIYKAFAFSWFSALLIANREKAKPKKALNEVIQAVI